MRVTGDEWPKLIGTVTPLAWPLDLASSCASVTACRRMNYVWSAMWLGVSYSTLLLCILGWSKERNDADYRKKMTMVSATSHLFPG